MSRKATACRLPQLYTLKDLTQRLRLSPSKLYSALREQQLRPTRIGRSLRFAEPDVMEYIQRSGRGSAD